MSHSTFWGRILWFETTKTVNQQLNQMISSFITWSNSKLSFIFAPKNCGYWWIDYQASASDSSGRSTWQPSTCTGSTRLVPFLGACKETGCSKRSLEIICGYHSPPTTRCSRFSTWTPMPSLNQLIKIDVDDEKLVTNKSSIAFVRFGMTKLAIVLAYCVPPEDNLALFFLGNSKIWPF